MLRETKNTIYSSLPTKEIKEYVISVNDQLSFRFYRNNGFEILGGTSANAEENSAQNNPVNLSTFFTVEQDGLAKMPYLGKVSLAGLTLRQAEAFLESQYDSIFVQPFIILGVNNRRVIVSRGDGSSQVIGLNNNNITLYEVLAMAGGIASRGKAKNIKVIRKTPTGQDIYKIDLRTLDSLELAYIPVQSNDIIHIEPRKNYLQNITQEITPYLTLFTTIIAIYTAAQIVK